MLIALQSRPSGLSKLKRSIQVIVATHFFSNWSFWLRNWQTGFPNLYDLCETR